MMNQALRTRMKVAHATTVDLLGTTLQWTSVDGAMTDTCVGGFKIVGKDDVAVINAYGADTRIITLSTATTSIVPGQFDIFMAHGLAYVVQAVNEIWLNDDLIGFGCYCKGR
jgi:hypothetical protein